MSIPRGNEKGGLSILHHITPHNYMNYTIQYNILYECTLTSTHNALRIHIRFTLEEHSHSRYMSIQSGYTKWSPSELDPHHITIRTTQLDVHACILSNINLVHRINSSSSDQQQLHSFNMSILRGVTKRSHSTLYSPHQSTQHLQKDTNT